MKPERVIHGARFDDFDGFCREFSVSVLGGSYSWQGNLDAFNDILRGGFGTPEGGFTLVWRDSARSRQVLGYDAKIRWLEDLRTTCHPLNVDDVNARLEATRLRTGPTLFDDIVEIIQVHGPGGAESEDAVDLVLA